jgi:hypothetical protein
MAERSVFVFVHEVFKSRFISEFNGEYLKKLAAKYNNRYFFWPGFDNLGDAIEKEFDSMESELRRDDARKARNYLAEDYTASYEYLTHHLKQARERALEDGFSVEQEDDLRTAGKFLLRAKKDILRIMRICPGDSIITEYASYEQVLEALDKTSEDLHLLWEFPYSYHQVRPLYFELRAAIAKEDYNAAADLQARIETMVADNNNT